MWAEGLGDDSEGSLIFVELDGAAKEQAAEQVVLFKKRDLERCCLDGALERPVGIVSEANKAREVVH